MGRIEPEAFELRNLTFADKLVESEISQSREAAARVVGGVEVSEMNFKPATTVIAEALELSRIS